MLIVLAGLVGVAAGLGLLWWHQPAFAIKVLRWVSERGGDRDAAALARLLSAPAYSRIDIVYDARHDPPLALDLHRPAAAAGNAAPPVLFWIHGGGFFSGHKAQAAPYLQLLAERGVASVAVDYTLTPQAAHPTQLHEVWRALGHVRRHAADWGLDETRLFIGGESAGAQLAAQLSAALTDPAYARRLGLEPAGDGWRPRGVVLFAGVYELRMLNLEGPYRWFLRPMLWAFTGTLEFRQHPAMDDASVLRHATASFPPSFVSAGNADPLLRQSQAFAQRLKELGVPVQTLFFDASEQPPQRHGYQFDLQQPQGRRAFEAASAFVGGSGVAVAPSR
jgi:acetyl esterase/lipase